jgi:hypothetical protein
MPHAPAALPLRKEPLLCCWWLANASHSTVTVLSIQWQHLQLKRCSYERTHGQVQQETAQHDRGLFQCVTAVSAPSILGINAPTSNSKGKGHPETSHEGPELEWRCNVTLSLTSALDGSGWSMPRPGCFTPRKDPVPIV